MEVKSLSGEAFAGTLAIQVPEGLSAEPAELPVALEPGETATLKVTLIAAADVLEALDENDLKAGLLLTAVARVVDAEGQMVSNDIAAAVVLVKP